MYAMLNWKYRFIIIKHLTRVLYSALFCVKFPLTLFVKEEMGKSFAGTTIEIPAGILKGGF